MFDVAESWSAALNRCVLLGGHLAVPNGPAEDTFLSQFGQLGPRPWLGMTDARGEGTFATVTGEDFRASLFDFGQPDDINEGEDCVHLGTRDGTWNDFRCDGNGQAAALCEIPRQGETFCGDGFVQPALGEACDPGLSACAADCGSATSSPTGLAQGPTLTYLAFADLLSFANARSACRALNGDLAMPGSAVELEAVQAALVRVSSVGWIGFSDELSEAGSNGFAFRRVDTNAPIGFDNQCTVTSPFVCQL